MRASYDAGLIRKFLEGLPPSKHEDLTHKFWEWGFVLLGIAFPSVK
jgi:hypothetical protein